MQRGEKKNWIIGALLVAVVAMSVGYAALGQTLNISGTADTGDARWNVKFTNIVEGTLTNAETVGTINYTDTTATFAVDLKEPGASANYIITVTNAGNIDAELSSLTDLAELNAQAPTDVTFTLTGVTQGTKLAAGGTNTVTVTAVWDADSTAVPTETTSKVATITLTYVQDI